MSRIFQIFSDIHTELYNKWPRIQKLADNLILVGDIGIINDSNIFNEFMKYCSETWTHVYYVPGNHEFYQYNENNILTFDELIQRYKNISNIYNNIHVLIDDFIELDENTNIYGSIFFTKPELVFMFFINDYKMIYMEKDKNINWSFMLKIYKEQQNKFKQYLENNKHKKHIIITHYPPIRNNVSDPKYNNKKPNLSTYFSHDITSFDENITSWIYGHTHYNNDQVINNIRFISNQVGYKSDNLVFKQDGIFNL